MSKNKRKETVETHCPSCGKFTGTYERCPYCGAEVNKRLSLKFFRYGSLILAVMGVFFIYLAAVNKEIPELDYEHISETMNFAFVRVKGEVVGQPNVFYRESGSIGSLSFTVDTGYQEIRIMAYSNIAEDILKAGNDPVPGEEVEISGSFRIKDEGSTLSLFIQAPQHLKIKDREEIQHKNFWEISSHDESRYFYISGIIKRIEPSTGTGPGRIVIMSEEGKTGYLTVWDNVLEIIMNREGNDFAPGAEFKSRILVNVFRDNVQLLLNFPANFEIQSPPQPGKDISDYMNIEQVEFVDIRPEDEGQHFEIEGIIESLEPSETAAPNKINIVDEYGNRSSLTIWHDVFEALRSIYGSDLRKGALFKGVIQANVFQNQLQLLLNTAQDFKLTGETDEIPEKKARTVEREISLKDEGMFIEVSGNIKELFNLEANGVPLLKCVFEYAHGEIDLIMWDDVIKNLSEDLEPGYHVSVKAYVEIYRDEPQLVLKEASNLTVNKKEVVQKEVPKAVQVEDEFFTDKITTEMEGEIINLRGRVYDRDELNNGVKYTLRYNNERVTLLVWNNIIKYKPQLRNLSNNQLITVEGKVDVFRGDIEIVPNHSNQINIEEVR
ncbi:MAG: hypothetical protein ACQESP_00680 [Candidatus Muiribacteriota bacterium]